MQQNAGNARQAAMLATSASDAELEGGRAVERIVATMGEIGHSSRKSADITNVIEGIAFQTNILALNVAELRDQAACLEQVGSVFKLGAAGRTAIELSQTFRAHALRFKLLS